MSATPAIVRRLARATLVQAARVAEQSARGAGREAEVGVDVYPREEAIRFVASDRMALVANDLADAEIQDDTVRLTANVMGLAGATPALPPVYSELQLERRRARDFGLARFLNLFDHRALSFFYRIARKFRWPLLAERAGRGAPDPVVGLLSALVGFGDKGVRARLDVEDAALVPLVAHLGDQRRSAASVEAVLRLLTGLPLRVIEATPVWMPVPPGEQTRLGAATGQFAQLGSTAAAGAIGTSEAAMIGAAVLDVQHHYLVEIGPVSYPQLQRFCAGSEARRIVSQLCVLAAGIEHRPSLRLLVARAEVPPLRLGDHAAPALLGWTTWTGDVAGAGVLDDCVIPMDGAAIH